MYPFCTELRDTFLNYSKLILSCARSFSSPFSLKKKKKKFVGGQNNLIFLYDLSEIIYIINNTFSGNLSVRGGKKKKKKKKNPLPPPEKSSAGNVLVNKNDDWLVTPVK